MYSHEQRQEREDARVDAGNARSWQLINALLVEAFDAAQLGRADQVILDLEDAVDPANKAKAREGVIAWLKSGGAGWVRINDRTSDFWRDDVTMLAGLPGLKGVMLAKVEGAVQVTDTAQALGATPVVALVESALGIEEAVAIARAEGVFRLAFGSGDYRRDTGAENTPLAMAYPRSRLVNASRIGGLPGPIDGPTVGGTHALLREQAADAVSLGMTGKLCLDLEQPAVINEAMSPSPADLVWANSFMAEFNEAGGVIRDGSDKPRLARAQTIQRRAVVFGITVD